MTAKVPRYIHITAIAMASTNTLGCQAFWDAITEPNVICKGRRYHITASIQQTALDSQSNPTGTPADCLQVTGNLISLADYPSVWETELSASSGTIINQNTLARIHSMMDAISAGEGSGAPEVEQEAYLSVVTPIIESLYDDCYDSLTDPYIGCSGVSAANICTERVRNPLEASFLNLDLGPTYVEPEWTHSDEVGLGADGWCFEDNGDTDSGTGSNDPGQGETGEIGTSSADSTSGADVTGTSEGVEDLEAPFGAMDELVHCNPGYTWCAYQPELVDNITERASVFHDEGAELQLLQPGEAGYPGLRILGLDRGEVSTALADAFGFQDGDIIRSLDDVVLSSEEIALSVGLKIFEKGSAHVTYLRGSQLRETKIQSR